MPQQIRSGLPLSVFFLAFVAWSTSQGLAEPAKQKTAEAVYVPEPRPVSCKYDIGVFYFPGWDSAARWAPILKYPERKPILGWYDEANPECVDWQIKWAVEHGIRFFMVDWYWDQGRVQLDHWVHKGYMNARYRHYLQWCVMWANHNAPGSHSTDDWQKVTQYWIDKYFCMKEYYRIDNRPVVVIWAPSNIRRDVGGSDQVAKIFILSQEMAKKAGYKGIFFIAMDCHPRAASVYAQQKTEGYEAATTYHAFPFTQERISPTHRFPFSEVVRYSPELWRIENDRSGGLDYLPIVETGWSNEPWAGKEALVIYDRTPEQFGNLCRLAREFVDKHHKKIVAVGPWNEWGEGSFIEPYTQHGFAHLDQLRAAFCEPDNYPPNLTPSNIGLGPYDLPSLSQKKTGRN